MSTPSGIGSTEAVKVLQAEADKINREYQEQGSDKRVVPNIETGELELMVNGGHPAPRMRQGFAATGASPAES